MKTPNISQADDGSALIFAEEQTVARENDNNTWKVIIVDDDSEIHTMTKMVLRDFTFQDRGFSLLNAFTGNEAKRLIRDNPDTAIVLLDVVMETEDAGLQVVDYIRNELENTYVRIILRTGHPGQAPEHKVIVQYDINDYKEKSELTVQKFTTAVVTALRSYTDLLRIEAMSRDLRVKERLEREIELARDVQRFLFPSTIPNPPGIQLAAYNQQAQQVGGDYYDFLTLPSGELTIVVADVSGKGAPAALVMAAARGALRAIGPEAKGPKDLLVKLNRFIIDDLRKDMFITMIALTVDPAARRLRVARAGHDPMLRMAPQNYDSDFVQPKGIALGLIGKKDFADSMEEIELPLLKGQRYALYTDGIIDARNDKGEEFSINRLLKILREEMRLSPADTIGRVVKDLQDFIKQTPQFDDITLLVLDIVV